MRRISVIMLNYKCVCYIIIEFVFSISLCNFWFCVKIGSWWCVFKKGNFKWVMILMFKIEYKLNCMMWNMFVVVSFDYSESLF